MAGRSIVSSVAGGATGDMLGMGRPPERGDAKVQKVCSEEGSESFLQGIYTKFYILQDRFLQ